MFCSNDFNYYYYYYYFTPCEFSPQSQLVVIQWSLSDSKCPQVSKTLLRILVNFNNGVVWMVAFLFLISNSSSVLSKPLGTIANTPITIGITITPMFLNFLSSLARFKYLTIFSRSFLFTLWSTGTAKFTWLQVLFFLLINSGHLAWI